MWWKFFDLVPGVVWAIVCALLLAATGTSYVRMNSAQSDLADYRAEVADNTAKAQTQARAKEQALQRQTERIADDAAKKQTVLAARAATTQLIAGQLRDEIERLNARPAPTGAESAAYAGEARTARQLLGACTEEYRGVAKHADELRDQVSGLHGYVSAVCTAP
jgi:chromosome segregation ATPase